jgi:hypothetical protein
LIEPVIKEVVKQYLLDVVIKTGRFKMIETDDQPDVDQEQWGPELAGLTDAQLVGNHLMGLSQWHRPDSPPRLAFGALGVGGSKRGKILLIIMEPVIQLLSQSTFFNSNQRVSNLIKL